MNEGNYGSQEAAFDEDVTTTLVTKLLFRNDRRRALPSKLNTRC